MNVATNENYTVNEIAKIALKACNADKFEIKYDKSKPNGQYRKDVDITILKSYFPDFKPIKLSEGIKLPVSKRSPSFPFIKISFGPVGQLLDMIGTP